jgi:hypothetical protein
MKAKIGSRYWSIMIFKIRTIIDQNSPSAAAHLAASFSLAENRYTFGGSYTTTISRIAT